MTPRSRPRALACALLVVALAAGAIPAAADSTPTPTREFEIHFFKEARPLSLDGSRIAVRAADVGRAATACADTGWTLAMDDRDHPADWFLCEIAADRRAAPMSVPDVVERISRNASVEFVSPVFVDDLGGPLIVSPDVIVRCDEQLDTSAAESLLAGFRGMRIVERDFGGMRGAYRLRGDGRSGLDVLEAANALARMPQIRWAEPDMAFSGRGVLIPNDPGFPQLWGLHNTGQSGGVVDRDMDGPEAWDITLGDASVLTVVLDTGVQQNHPDIHQVPGIDTTTDPGDGGPFNDCDNHGTAVAGCISATINNGLGVVGIAPGTRSASARTFISTASCTGSWNSQVSWTVASLSWAQQIGARVTNNSNYYGFTSSAIADKYSQTRAAGIVHFAAAGNNASATITYPSSLPSVNAVAALGRNGNRASFSNYGVGLAFSAPGDDILTTDRTGSAGYTSGDTALVDGTSFASPYAAGVAALVLSAAPTLTAARVERILGRSAVDLGASGYDTGFGWGLVNAEAALRAATLQCPGDTNGDGVVNVTDYVTVLLQFGPCVGCAGDVNGDGVVNAIDLILVIVFWGPCPTPVGACCLPAGGCTQTTQGHCALLSGPDWQASQPCNTACP